MNLEEFSWPWLGKAWGDWVELCFLRSWATKTEVAGNIYNQRECNHAKE